MRVIKHVWTIKELFSLQIAKQHEINPNTWFQRNGATSHTARQSMQTRVCFQITLSPSTVIFHDSRDPQIWQQTVSSCGGIWRVRCSVMYPHEILNNSNKELSLSFKNNSVKIPIKEESAVESLYQCWITIQKRKLKGGMKIQRLDSNKSRIFCWEERRIRRIISE